MTLTGQLTTSAATEEGADSSEHARLALAMLIVRSVNILADSVQQGAHAASISDLASRLGLPRWLVDIRHEATHGGLPSMHTCRLAREALLAWFKDKYWTPQHERVTQSLAVPTCVRLPPLAPGETGSAGATTVQNNKVYKRPRTTEAQSRGVTKRIAVSSDALSWCTCLVAELCSLPSGTASFIGWTQARGPAIHTWLQGMGVQGIRALMARVAEAQSRCQPSSPASLHCQALACYLCSLAVWRVEGPDASPASKRARLVIALPWPEERLSPMSAPAVLMGLRPGHAHDAPVLLDPRGTVMDFASYGAGRGGTTGTGAEHAMRQAFALTTSHVLSSALVVSVPGREPRDMATPSLVWYV